LQPLRLISLLLFCGFFYAVPAQAESAQVKYVIDGDTVVLSDNRHVRLLAINTPEVKSKKRRAEAGGEAAKNWLKQQIEGQTVRLVADRQKYDNYGRSLFYLFDSQGRLINEQLLEKGYAALNIYPPNLKYLSRLQAAQHRAGKQRLGIWGLSAYQPVKLAQLSKKHNGWQRIIVTPEAIKQSGKYVRLILRLNLGPAADIRIGKKNLQYFPLLESYLGCELEVRGWASWRKGSVSILVRHPSAVLIKDSNQCAETL
jgi:endonuclease YncB( thermonuclease family)